MADTAATIIAEARALLNDPSGALYKDAPMLTLAAKVYRELQTKIAAMGAGSNREITSSPVAVVAGTVALSSGAGLPADLLLPVQIWERPSGSGSSVLWEPMTELYWEPNIVIGPYLTYWTWREEEIKFPGATTDREVKIRYKKALTAITATTTPIAILNATTWLGQRLAAVAALTLGNNPTRAAALQGDLGDLWSDFKTTLVRQKQGTPVRRKRSRYRVY